MMNDMALCGDSFCGLEAGPLISEPKTLTGPSREFLISLGSFLLLFPEKGKGWFICSFNKEHSLLFCCGIYYRKKWPNPGKEKTSKQTNKNVSWRPCRSTRLHLPAELCRFGAPCCPLPACVCVLCSPVSCVPCVLCLVYPMFCQKQTSQPWWAGKITAK